MVIIIAMRLLRDHVYYTNHTDCAIIGEVRLVLNDRFDFHRKHRYAN